MSDQNLAGRYSPIRCEDVLMCWANLAEPSTPDFDNGVKRLCKLFPDIATELLHIIPGDIKREEWLQEEDFLEHVWFVGKHLQDAWGERDIREREWYIFKLRELNLKFADKYFNDEPKLKILHLKEFSRTRTWSYRIDRAPALTPFEQIMIYFQKSASRALRCANPDCPAPYFFNTKKGQIYCTEACAAFGQREAKKKWWANNGRKWRKKNAAKKGQSR